MPEFVDTNVLIYAHDSSAGVRHERAAALVEELWTSGEGSLSIQVLQEFFVTVTRKVPAPLSAEAARETMADLSHWHLHEPHAGDVLEAIDLHSRHGLSFWDAMIVRSALALSCSVLHSEDLSAGGRYDGVEVVDPFQGG
jgi:predicted nucleic acid-binding protein